MIFSPTQLASVESEQSPIPAWLNRIPGVPILVDRLEFRRRLFHMLPALLPIGLPITPHEDVWEPWLILGAFASAILAIFMAVALASQVTRPGERHWMAAVLGYITPLLGALVLFPGRAELALMTLQIVALGDGSAVLGGKLLGGKTLPWNPHKTFSGLFCFVFVGSLAATCSYLGEARPAVSFSAAFLICSVAACCAGIAESLPIRASDNFRVGVTALLVGAVMSSWLAQ